MDCKHNNDFILTLKRGQLTKQEAKHLHLLYQNAEKYHKSSIWLRSQINEDHVHFLDTLTCRKQLMSSLVEKSSNSLVSGTYESQTGLEPMTSLCHFGQAIHF